MWDSILPLDFRNCLVSLPDQLMQPVGQRSWDPEKEWSHMAILAWLSNKGCEWGSFPQEKLLALHVLWTNLQKYAYLKRLLVFLFACDIWISTHIFYDIFLCFILPHNPLFTSRTGNYCMFVSTKKLKKNKISWLNEFFSKILSSELIDNSP